MTRYSDHKTYQPNAFKGLFMARPIATLLKEASQIENSKHLNQTQKDHALTMLKREIDAATGQMALELGQEAKTGGTPQPPEQPVLKEGDRPKATR